VDEIMINRIIKQLKQHQAVVPCVASSNTIYQIDASGVVEKVLDKATLGVVQTPQAFKTDVIKNVHNKAILENKTDFTDDAGLLLYYDTCKVQTVEGSSENIKITYKSDL